MGLTRTSKQLELACLNNAEEHELFALLDAVEYELAPVMRGLRKLVAQTPATVT
jgi:hypothetical protein